MTQRGRGSKRVRETFEATCIVERLPGIINVYRGVICYLPEDKFNVRDKVRVTVELLARTRKG